MMNFESGGQTAGSGACAAASGWTGEEELEGTEPGAGSGGFAFRPADASESGRLREFVRHEEELLEHDFEAMRNEAREEFRNMRAQIVNRYEERLVAAKQQYLEDAVSSRERLLTNRRLAREEYEESLRNAQNDYEFTVDIVKDHYQTIRKETAVLAKPGSSPAGPGGKSARAEKSTTRVMKRLDEEIRLVVAKKAEEEARLEAPC